MESGYRGRGRGRGNDGYGGGGRGRGGSYGGEGRGRGRGRGDNAGGGYGGGGRYQQESHQYSDQYSHQHQQRYQSQMEQSSGSWRQSGGDRHQVEARSERSSRDSGHGGQGGGRGAGVWGGRGGVWEPMPSATNQPENASPGKDQAEATPARSEGSSRDSGRGGGGVWGNRGGGRVGGVWGNRGGGAAGGGGVWEPVPSATSQPDPLDSNTASPDSVASGVQRMKVSSQVSGPSGSKNQNVPIQRPDKGGSNSIRSVRLRVNHFLVNYNPERVIMHYDVDVKPEIPPKHGRSTKILKSDLSMIRDKLSEDNPSKFPLSSTAYDGEKNIFSAVPLPTGKFTVKLSKADDTFRSFIVTIKLVNQLKLGKLSDYIRGRLPSIPRDILQGMDLVMKENPTRKMIPFGRNFYPKEPHPEDDLGGGIFAFRGLQHSLKPTSQGLSLCLDYSVMAFRKRMPVLEFLETHIYGFNLNEFRRYRKDVEDALRGLKVYVTHRRTKQKYVVRGLARENARQSKFVVVDPDGENPDTEIRLVKYFEEKYGKVIEHIDIPCLDLGKNNKRNDVPMEFCEIVEGQRYGKEQLDKDAAKQLKQWSLPPAYDREGLIQYMVRSSDGPCGGGIAQNFGFDVNMNMTSVSGRVIVPPELKLGAPNGKVTTITVDKEKCQWNLLRNSVVQGKSIERWVVLDFSQSEYKRYLKLDPNSFIPKLMSRCEKLGIRMAQPLAYIPTSMDKFSRVDLLRELLEGVNQRANKDGRGHLQLLVCVMSKRDPGYKYLKWISETKIGVVTQCCLSEVANKARDQDLANLALKINAKLGGSNVELGNRLPVPAGSGHVMFVGADVNHPGSRNEASPSIAAVVATMNWPAANRYAARVRAQNRRCERILDFGDMCLELVESYTRLNKAKPEKIIIFRDGVSEGQFDMVLNEELFDLRRAFGTINYSPTITLIVAQKRHQTRLFPASRNDGGSNGNVPPGTVVDTTVVHPFEFDFYLCSHYGSLGTSKPTHYHVLHDEHKLTSDQLQKLIYDMCFTMSRCTKPVSLVPPVYYADLVAYRGRLYHEAVTEGVSPPSVASSSLDERFFKLHADLENEMFFV